MMVAPAKLGLALLWVAAASACRPPSEGHRLGLVLSTSGALGELGVAQLEAATLAVEQINGAGGVLGRPLELAFRNDASSPARARQVAAELADEGVTAIVGSVSGELVLQVAAGAGPRAVVISGSATSAALSQRPDVFRTCASEEGEARLMVQRLRATGLTKVAVLRPESANINSVSDVFEARWKLEQGVAASRYPHQRAQRSYRALLTEVFAGGPEAIVVDADPIDAARIVSDYLDYFPTLPVRWYFSHAVELPSFLVAVGPQRFSFPHEGVGPGTPTGSRYADFAARFESKFGRPPDLGAFTANVFDAVFLMALAMEAGQSLEAASLREQLRPLSLGGTALGPGEFDRLVEALHKGADVNFEGASGSVDLDANGDTSAPYDLWNVREGRFSIIERAVRAPD